MTRRIQSAFTTIRSEGALLPPELLSRVAETDKNLGGLAPTDYHLGPTERLAEQISRSWNRLVGLWSSFEPQLGGFNPNDPGTGATRDRWLMPLLDELGFGRVPVAKAIEIDSRPYPISHLWQEVPIHLVGAGLDLDRRAPGVAGAAKVSPHSLVQDYLNRSEGLWGIVSNGRELRVLRDNVSLTRQAYLAFDLQAMFSGEAYSDFAVLWLIAHQSRFEALEGRAEGCWLERWSEAARTQGTRALETLRQGVEEAIRSFGSGFLAHPANEALRTRLRTGELDKHDYYRQLLRLVYRFMFLFVAEDRDLLHPSGAPEPARSTYASYYSTARLRALSKRRRGTKHADLWRGLQIVIGALGRDEGAPALGLSYLGSALFSPEACPDLDAADCSNTYLLAAVRSLGFTQQGRTLRQIDYRNMGSEELGSIYESLLELHPEIYMETAKFELSTAAGHERKTTGSYYTPTSLISALLDSTLDPVLEQAAAKGAEAILDLKVLDPACGSGHFLTAAAHRMARRLASMRTDEPEPAPEAYRAALRDVIGHCVFGIDVNPMAVELCKVSLWMESVEPGRPLSFLDHHIVCGNSLLGTTPKLLDGGIPDEAFTVLEGDDKAVVKSLRARNKEERKGQASLFGEAALPDLVSPIAERVTALEATSDDSADALHAKQRAWKDLETSEELIHAKHIADAWCAAFVMNKTNQAQVLTQGVFNVLRSDPFTEDPKLHSAISELAGQFRFLHPHLAFPQVFRVAAARKGHDSPEQGWSGGFDVVLGNPPWERVKVQEKEWFAKRSPDIAGANNAANRKEMIRALERDDPILFQEWKDTLRHADGESHLLRDTRRYPLCGRGDVNTYAVFAELMRELISPTGRLGSILPTGIATDATTQYFFRELTESRSLSSLFDFENAVGLFPGVGHGRFKFCLLTVAGRERQVEQFEFCFFAHHPSDLLQDGRRFTLSAADLDLINPNTGTCPIFRSERDADITKGIYRELPVLVNEAKDGPGGPWGIALSEFFHMANDSVLFASHDQLEREGYRLSGNRFVKGDDTYVALYEAKMFHFFNHRWGDYSMRAPGSQDTQLPDVPEDLLSNPDYVPLPQYWTRLSEVESRLDGKWSHRWLLAYRKIARATDERTFIPCMLPESAIPNSAITAFPSAGSPTGVALLLANWSSFAFDYVVRQKLGGSNLVHFIVRQLPVPPPETYEHAAAWSSGSRLGDWILPRVLELVFTARDLRPFAESIGYSGSPFRWNQERRVQLRAELDAAFFHLYGLGREDTAHVLDTFAIVKRSDERLHGEYRTKRLILERYDEMARAIETGLPYESSLDPPPADPRVAHGELRSGVARGL